MYGIMYGMKRTTVYLPDEMKAAIEREAARRGVTEAEVIRDAVATAIDARPSRRAITPAIPEGLGEEIGTRVDAILEELAANGLDDW